MSRPRVENSHCHRLDQPINHRINLAITERKPITQVLGDQAVVDPSKVEELVKGQVQRRKAQHEARNQAAKLTPQEKKDKKKKKLLEDTSKELQVRCGTMGCNAVRFLFVFHPFLACSQLNH